MPNLFDNMRGTLFRLTTKTFGYGAIWIASDANPEDFPAQVNHRVPNEQDMIMSGMTYMPLVPFMEYQEGTFPGLYESVRSGAAEYVNIEGQINLISSVNRVYDGKTYHAHLQQIS